MKNLKEFNALIRRYETITLEEIETAISDDGISLAAHTLTGFGKFDTCTLCIKMKKQIHFDKCCLGCVWCHINPYATALACSMGRAEKTYEAIDGARTAKGLLKAYKARARFMRKCLREAGITNNKK